MNDPTGYGPSNSRFARLVFNGDERKYEQWEMKFLGYLRLQKLRDVILTPEGEEVDEDKNAEAYAEMIQFLDDKSLSLVMRDAAEDGRKALKILRSYYASSSTPRVISLYTELTSLVKRSNETVTDYIIRAETAAAALRSAEEDVSDSLLIAMVLKGLPGTYQSFIAVVTQSDKKQTFSEFKSALRSFEETEKSRVNTEDSVLRYKTVSVRSNFDPRSKNLSNLVKRENSCFECGQQGHFKRDCPSKKANKLWCSFCKKNNHTDQTCRSKKKVGQNSHSTQVHNAAHHFDEAGHSFAFKIDAHKTYMKCQESLLVDCGATSHIFNDLSKFTKFDSNFNPSEHFIELANGVKTNNLAMKRGQVNITMVDENGNKYSGDLNNVLYVPSFPQNIFSVQAAAQNGASVYFMPDSAQLVDKGGRRFDIHKHGRLYYLHTDDSAETDADTSDVHVNYTSDLQDWHKILGHCNFEDVKKLEGVVDGMKVNKNEKSECEICLEGKMTNETSKTPRVRSKVPLQLVHTDLAGPITPESTEGFKYTLAFTDDFSGMSFVYFLKQKSNTVAATKRFLADASPYGTVKSIRSDNGTEFTSGEFRSLMQERGIKQEMSAPYSPHQNGTAERHWRTIFEMGRCLLIESKLTKEMWPYAVNTATYIRNRCYSEHLKDTPYHKFTGRKPNLSNMRPFGSECYAYVQNKQKLDARGKKGIFVGYDRESPAYLVYYPNTGKVCRHRVVKFLSVKREEDFLVDEGKAHDQSPDDEIDDLLLERRQEEEKPQNADKEQNTHRYPRRETRPPKYLNDYETCYETNVDDDHDHEDCTNYDYCYKMLFSVPKTYKEAIKSPESVSWKEAMDEEINCLKENETFTLTELPEGRNAVGGRWVYTMKEDSNGSKSYKARYVAKGYSQIKGVDYNETFAPTANITSIRVLMQLAAQYGLILHQMDVKTAYLNAPIDSEIYMEQPEGFETKGANGNKLIYKLNKSLYGLKQSGRNWNNLLHTYLVENNFVQSQSDHCVYTKSTEDETIIIVVWVDDLVIATNTEDAMCKTKNVLKDRFRMKDLGKLTFFLGIHFEQGDGYVKMNQKRYIQKILERFDMADCKPRTTPSEQKIDCSSDGDPINETKYREAVGSLIYVMMCTRPDICWIITKLSQYLSKPMTCHWVAVKHVFRYLKGTMDHELVYRKNNDSLSLTGYCDADWASSPDDRRSTSGYCFSLTASGPLVSWKSRKQPSVALSSCEAEYMALATAVQEGLYLGQLLTDIDRDYQSAPALIFEDNQGTIALANNPVNRQRSKHIDIKFHFIRSELKNGKFVLKYCPTSDMLADIMTKPATRFQLQKFQSLIFG